MTQDQPDCHLEQVLYEVDRHVWRMEGVDDLPDVLAAVRQALQEEDIPFDACAVYQVEEKCTGATIRLHNMTRDGTWSTYTVGDDDKRGRYLLDCWRSGKVAWRTDLREEDRFRERRVLTDMYGFEVRSVIEVPFAQGALSLSSQNPGSFSESHINLMRRLAESLEDGFRRVDDLRKLSEASERYRLLADAAFEALVVHDSERIIDVNQATVEMFGAESADKLIGRSPFLFLEPEAREKAAEVIARVNGEAYEVVGRRLDGARLWLVIRGRHMMWEGRSVRVVALRDITRRKRLEAELELRVRIAESVEQLGLSRGVDSLEEAWGRIIQAVDVSLRPEAAVIYWKGEGQMEPVARIGKEGPRSPVDLDEPESLVSKAMANLQPCREGRYACAPLSDNERGVGVLWLHLPDDSLLEPKVLANGMWRLASQSSMLVRNVLLSMRLAEGEIDLDRLVEELGDDCT